MRTPRACSDSVFRRGQPVDVSANASKLSGSPSNQTVQKDFGGQITRREICDRCCVDPLRPPCKADIELTGAEWPVLTQSGHSQPVVPCTKADAQPRYSAAISTQATKA